MRPGTASLLRLIAHASGLLALVALATLAVAAGGLAAGPSPDPSPPVSSSSPGLVRPDPYGAQARPAQAPARAARPSAPPREGVPASQPRRASKHTTPAAKRNRPASVTPVAPLRRPAPAVTTGASAVADSVRGVSRTLALTIAGLVLLSGCFVAGAAREVAR